MKSSDMPRVVSDLSKFQVVDGVVVPRTDRRLWVPVSSSGLQYGKGSGLGGQRLYLTYDEKWWLCFPFSDLHARFVYNGDVEYHRKANLARVLGKAVEDYLLPVEVLKVLYGNGDFPFSMEVFDSQNGQKRRYGKTDFLADMLRGPAANLVDKTGECPSYLRPFRTAFGVDPFAIVAPPGPSSENRVFALNRPWSVWVNPTNFNGVTVFMPAAGLHAVGMPEGGINFCEGRKLSVSYGATREQLVDTKELLAADMAANGVYLNGERLKDTPVMSEMLVPFVSEELHYPETLSSNVFVVLNEHGKKVLQTPPAEYGNYPGITRFFVLKLAEILLPLGLIDEVREGRLTRELLMKGNVVEMFRTGSASGVNFVNALLWFDNLERRYVARQFGNVPGKVTAVVSEVFEGVARGYEMHVPTRPDLDLSCLRRFGKMTVRLELPEGKFEPSLKTFAPPSMSAFPQANVLEGMDPRREMKMFERRAALARTYDRSGLRELARSRY